MSHLKVFNYVVWQISKITYLSEIFPYFALFCDGINKGCNFDHISFAISTVILGNFPLTKLKDSAAKPPSVTNDELNCRRRMDTPNVFCPHCLSSCAASVTTILRQKQYYF